MRVLAILLALLVGRATAFADAGDEPETVNGKAYFNDGLAAFQRGDHAAASRAFAAGWEVEKWSGFLFAWGQAERIAGHCPKAIELYSRFIGTKPKPDAREHAIGWIKACGGEYKEPAEAPKPAAPAKPPPPPQYTRVARPAGGFHHKLAVGLGVGAITSGVVGVRFLRLAERDFDTAKKQLDYDDIERIYERGERRLLYGRLAVGFGVGLAGAAVARFLLHDAPTRFELVPMANGAAIAGAF